MNPDTFLHELLDGVFRFSQIVFSKGPVVLDAFCFPPTLLKATPAKKLIRFVVDGVALFITPCLIVDINFISRS